MKIRRFIAAFAVLLVGGVAFGQSKSFKMGQWVEINNAILKELNKSYVDSLPLSRMELVGINAMLENLDPYTVYIPEEDKDDLQMMINKTYGGIGAVIYKPKKEGYLIVNEPYENTPSTKVGLECGDEILEIEGATTEGLTAQQCTDKMKGKPGTDLHMKVKKVRTGKIEDIVLKRELIHLPDIEYYGMLNDTTGYISQSGFTTNVSQSIRDAFIDLKKQGMKRLIYDLRGNGGGLLNEAVNIVSLFVPKGSLVVTQKGKSLENDMEYRTTTSPIDTKMPIVMLVGGGSASASEIVTGALQDMDRATVMGTRTYGKGLVQGIRPLPYGGQMKVTIAKYYTPSGRCVQAIDYAKRGEDGSVKAIPDSLTNVFHTKSGREVRDGGGITPDIIINPEKVSRLTFSLILNGLINEFPLEYVKNHDKIASPDKFHITDQDFEDFINMAKNKDFDFRSDSKTNYDRLIESLKEDKVYDSIKDDLEPINKVLNMSKEEAIRMHKDEIVPLLEREIIARYYFRPAAYRFFLNSDEQLKQVLKTKSLF